MLVCSGEKVAEEIETVGKTLKKLSLWSDLRVNLA